jgi:hypothetical protein
MTTFSIFLNHAVIFNSAYLHMYFSNLRKMLAMPMGLRLSRIFYGEFFLPFASHSTASLSVTFVLVCKKVVP